MSSNTGRLQIRRNVYLGSPTGIRSALRCPYDNPFVPECHFAEGRVRLIPRTSISAPYELLNAYPACITQLYTLFRDGIL